MLLRNTRRTLARYADHLLVEKFIKGSQRALSDPGEIRELTGWLHELAADYERAGVHRSPEAFFPAPELPRPTVQRLRDRRNLSLWWGSDYAPFYEESAPAYMQDIKNHTAHAQVFRGSEDWERPVVIFVHGYRGGILPVERLMWPLDAWQQAGYDLALVVLPHHATRQASLRQRPLIPSIDPRLTIDGVRQAVGDVRALMRWLKEQGAPRVGVSGLSFGGLVNGVMLGVAPELDFGAPVAPLVSFVTWAEDHGTLLGEGEVQAAYREAFVRVMRPIDPLARRALVRGPLVRVIAGQQDRINRPHQAEALAAHASAELETFDGGHLLQFGVRKAFERTAFRLRRALEGEA